MIKDKKKVLVIYEIFMAVLALVIVAILFIEFTRPLTESQEILLANIDLSILIIFAVDYFYRLAKAKEKWHFIKSNIFDLIAIMPFDKAFRIARLARLTRLARLARTTRVARLLRLTKIIRLFAFARRFGCTFSGVLKTNGLAYVVIVTFGIVLIGAFGIMAFEDNMQTFGDALWWSLVTTTTVGYGDISPESSGGRVLAGLLMIVGIGFLGMVTGSVATYFVDRLSKSEKIIKTSTIDEQIEYVKSKLDEIDSMTEAECEFLWEIVRTIRSSKSLLKAE
jgi:voltage-gated potassium channel